MLVHTMITSRGSFSSSLLLGRSSLNRKTVRNISSRSGDSFTINTPSPTTDSWERGAKTVKNTDTSNQYLEQIRDSHDPSLHLKTLEDELKGTMGKALGKQGDKILRALKKAEDERLKYEQILSSLCLNKPGLKLEYDDVQRLSSSVKKDIYFIVHNHNRCREDAVHARWELLVHRQAVGFITGNNRLVHEKFPIPEKLEVPDNIGEWDTDGVQMPTRKTVKEPVTRVFGDQLDWWENVGRWR